MYLLIYVPLFVVYFIIVCLHCNFMKKKLPASWEATHQFHPIYKNNAITTWKYLAYLLSPTRGRMDVYYVYVIRVMLFVLIMLLVAQAILHEPV